jgi:hypothetical protein
MELSKGDKAILACPNIMELVERRCAVDPGSGCWLWTGAVSLDGYAMHGYWLSEKGATKSFSVARAVLAHKLGRLPKVTRHTCDVPRCCNPDHLIDGTRSSNRIDYMLRGNWSGRKLTPKFAAEIIASKEKSRALARKYNISEQTICDIRKGRTWAHLRDSGD